MLKITILASNAVSSFAQVL